MNRPSFLVGFGYDCHKIVKNKNLFLAGVKIEDKFGLKGHSDADVVLHSVCDAVLSSLGLPDIGQLFPDNEDKYKNISSVEIVKKTLHLLKERKYSIVNIDITLICDRPKISLFKNKLLNSLKKLFNIENINIKGKTTESIKCFKNYIQCYTVVLLTKNENI